VPGGHSIGMSSLLIQGGIHRERLGIEPGERADTSALEAEIVRWGHRPSYTQPLLAW